MQALFKLQSATRSDFEQVHKLLASCEAELAQMEATCAPEHLRNDYTLGFDLDANRGELGPTPPRSAEPISLAELWPEMRALLLHLRLLCDLPKVGSTHITMHRAAKIIYALLASHLTGTIAGN